MLRILYNVNLQVSCELCLKIAWKSFDCPIVSLNEMILYDTPLLKSDIRPRPVSIF